MKRGGFYAFSLILLCSLLYPVAADEIYPTITDVYFTRNSLPYNESVQFTVNCYGYLCKSWDCQRDPSDLAARNGNFTPELVFSYHATCPSYGCRIHEPYFHAERNFGTSCSLGGVTQGRSFRIDNFSQSPIPENCSPLHQFSRSGGRNRYYNETADYRGCINETRRKSSRCDQYFLSCEPVMDSECGNQIADGQYVKETPSYRACMETIDRERTDCNRYLERIDPKNLIMWNYSGYAEEPAMRACDLRFEIPSDLAPMVASHSPEITIDPSLHEEGMVFGKPAIATARYVGPVEYLHCIALQFLGGRCE